MFVCDDNTFLFFIAYYNFVLLVVKVEIALWDKNSLYY